MLQHRSFLYRWFWLLPQKGKPRLSGSETSYRKWPESYKRDLQIQLLYWEQFLRQHEELLQTPAVQGRTWNGDTQTHKRYQRKLQNRTVRTTKVTGRRWNMNFEYQINFILISWLLNWRRRGAKNDCPQSTCTGTRLTYQFKPLFIWVIDENFSSVSALRPF